MLNQTLGDDILPPLLVTFGLSVILQNALLEIYTADPQKLNGGALETASVEVGGHCAGRAAAADLCHRGGGDRRAAMDLLPHRAGPRHSGRSVDNQDIAQLMGLNKAHVFGLAMALALAVTAIAGILLGHSHQL